MLKAFSAGCWLALLLISTDFSDLSYAQAEIAPQYDSATSVILDGTLENGMLLTREPFQNIDAQVRKQLRFLIGQLSYIAAAPQLSHFDVQVGIASPIDGHSGFYEVPYRATGRIAWERWFPVNPSLPIVLPARIDSEFQKEFNAKYVKTCSGNAETNAENFFYYFVPTLPECALKDPGLEDKIVVTRPHLRLELSPANTSAKSPEYGEIWKDGTLVITAIFGKYESKATSDSDVGVDAYNSFYRKMIARFGKPEWVSEPFPGDPGVSHPRLKMTFPHSRGQIDLALVLLDSMMDLGPEFTELYNERTLKSDLMIYNGHAGLGQNIEALGRIGSFSSGKYQIFVVNGCGTFSYLGGDLATAHARANPGFAPSKHLDVITNALSNYFVTYANGTMALINAVIEQKLTYREILAKYDKRQRAIVDGEEDNLWPRPF
jgi:hypothetical protein